ncbi:hypothetical protein DMP15_19925 [Pseudonocardia sp. UM4_GMWB1]
MLIMGGQPGRPWPRGRTGPGPGGWKPGGCPEAGGRPETARPDEVRGRPGPGSDEDPGLTRART